MSSDRIAVPQHLELGSCGTFSIDEAAKWLGIGRKAAYRAAHAGEIPVIKIGGRYLVPRVQLERMLNGEVEKKS